jgi:isopenicillin N synthase-like dioxygenase
MDVQKVSWLSPDFGKEIVDSFRNTGFAVVTEHTLDSRLVRLVYEDWEKFFSLPDEQKRARLFNPDTQAGWFPPKAEKAKDADFPDMKEFYHYYRDMEAPSSTGDLAAQLEKMATYILSSIQAELMNRGVTPTCNEPLSRTVKDSPKTLFRLLHYPPTRQFGLDAELMERAAPHEDINMITLLPAATNPGLQVKDVDGNWHDVDADPGTIIINVGDMLREATSGYLPSTTHRVVADFKARTESRYSMPLFLHPRPEVRLSERYTAKEYLEERLVQLGVKPPKITEEDTTDDVGRTYERPGGSDQKDEADDQREQPGGPQSEDEDGRRDGGS